MNPLHRSFERCFAKAEAAKNEAASWADVRGWEAAQDSEWSAVSAWAAQEAKKS